MTERDKKIRNACWACFLTVLAIFLLVVYILKP
jgi:hypothetical protein